MLQLFDPIQEETRQGRGEFFIFAVLICIFFLHENTVYHLKLWPVDWRTTYSRKGSEGGAYWNQRDIYYSDEEA